MYFCFDENILFKITTVIFSIFHFPLALFYEFILILICNFEYPFLQIVVLKTSTAKAATLDILTTHCIPSAMSDDLKT